MKKIALLSLPLILFFTVTNAQDLSIFMRGNLSIGADYQSLDYSGGDGYITYSGGGGIGMEVGLEKEVVKNLGVSLSLGYQLNRSFGLGATSSSSASFNRKYFGLGVIKSIQISERRITHLLIGAGTQYNFPGELKRIENDLDLGNIRYKSRFGLYFEGGFSIQLSEMISFNPMIRYRSLLLNANDYTSGPLAALESELQTYSADGLEFALTMVFKLK